ncbi:GNAT family N-acetyltransferase [Jiulongibacter sediminis]|jgi:predicted GNAT family acetyltransferase|uniref:Acyl-CoA acyltransferase n=1 Tax=Jiulongibacter sediminis TaxID=1605367 RepID=A0A0P7BI06_9BACT|nr:GNAT family N-acetyltransferase [Jiulongibacter sediminis]KPM46679.1 acyl-CoA acyltransferase [Jiulongibacter sediminis]TBX21585.1 acyl-CoA acyltransferase [Jiulongibacter sediminis]
MEVQLEQNEKKGKAFIDKDGKTLAEMTFSMAGTKQLIIDHTEVSDELRGMGAGRQLLQKIVDMAREESLKIIPLCPYAKSVFDKDDSIQDVLRQ